MTAKGTTSRLLLGRVAALDNLRAAWERVRGKGARGGLDGESVASFADRAEHQLDLLRAEILEERYVPAPPEEITIPKSSKPGERRTLGLPAVRDKIAQEAVRRVIEPQLDRTFKDCSYGYRAGRGPQRAVKRVSYEITDRKAQWIVRADIDDFFGSLDHDLLLATMRGHLLDEAVLRLLELWLKMGTVGANGRWRDVYSGVVQGNVVSPLLANCYLHPFDQSMTDQGLALVRYADDFIICCPDRRAAEQALQCATVFLSGRLKLGLNPNPRPVVAAEEGFEFLGIWFNSERRTIAAAKCDGARARIARLARAPISAGAALRQLNEAAAGWRRYYGVVVEDEDLTPLDDAVLDGIRAILARERAAGRLRTNAEGRDLVAHVELLRRRDAAQRAALLHDLVREACAAGSRRQNEEAGGEHRTPETRRHERDPDRNGPQRGQAASGDTTASAPAETHAPAKEAGRGQGARRGRNRRRQPGPYTGAGRRTSSIQAAVRARKREHLRRAAGISELVLATPGSFLGKASQRLVVRQQRRTVCETPAERLTSVTIEGFGASLSADAVALCAAHRVPILFLSPSGQLEAVLQAPSWGDGATALAQVGALAAQQPAVDLAALFVRGKVRNQVNLVKYFAKHRRRRDTVFGDACRAAVDAMEGLLADVPAVRALADLTEARGKLFSIEGRAAGFYWDVVTGVLQPRITFPGRRREGAVDLVNSMLNYGYAVLQAKVYHALVRAGLNPQISFLHALQPGKPTLAFDAMEEFRPPIVDRTVVALLSRRQPVAIDGGGRLTDATRRLLLAALHQRLASLVGWRCRDLTLQEVIGEQARALVKHLQGGRRYRSFASKW